MKKNAAPAMNPQYNLLAKSDRTDIRIQLQQMATILILENPVFGYGFNVIVRIGGDDYAMSPHSNILSVLLATGFVGGILFFGVFLMGIYDSCVVCRYHPEYVWLVAVWVYAFTVNIFDTKIISYPLFWIPIVALHAVVKTYRNERMSPAAAPSDHHA